MGEGEGRDELVRLLGGIAEDASDDPVVGLEGRIQDRLAGQAEGLEGLHGVARHGLSEPDRDARGRGGAGRRVLGVAKGGRRDAHEAGLLPGVLDGVPGGAQLTGAPCTGDPLVRHITPAGGPLQEIYVDRADLAVDRGRRGGRHARNDGALDDDVARNQLLAAELRVEPDERDEEGGRRPRGLGVGEDGSVQDPHDARRRRVEEEAVVQVPRDGRGTARARIADDGAQGGGEVDATPTGGLELVLGRVREDHVLAQGGVDDGRELELQVGDAGVVCRGKAQGVRGQRRVRAEGLDLADGQVDDDPRGVELRAAGAVEVAQAAPVGVGEDASLEGDRGRGPGHDPNRSIVDRRRVQEVVHHDLQGRVARDLREEPGRLVADVLDRLEAVHDLTEEDVEGGLLGPSVQGSDDRQLVPAGEGGGVQDEIEPVPLEARVDDRVGVGEDPGPVRRVGVDVHEPPVGDAAEPEVLRLAAEARVVDEAPP